MPWGSQCETSWWWVDGYFLKIRTILTQECNSLNHNGFYHNSNALNNKLNVRLCDIYGGSAQFVFLVLFWTSPSSSIMVLKISFYSISIIIKKQLIYIFSRPHKSRGNTRWRPALKRVLIIFRQQHDITLCCKKCI